MYEQNIFHRWIRLLQPNKCNKKFWKPHTISTLLYKCIKFDWEVLPLQQAGESTFNLPLLMKFHPLLLFAGGMRWFLLFSNCHHFIKEHTTPITKLAIQADIIRIQDISALFYFTIHILLFLWVMTVNSSDSRHLWWFFLPILILITLLIWYKWA